jgi:hypothetical protein
MINKRSLKKLMNLTRPLDKKKNKGNQTNNKQKKSHNNSQDKEKP